jgi:hypothetical protein
LVIIMMSSCKKDELIPSKVITIPKVIETKKSEKSFLKKRKFRLFKRKKYKVVKSCSRTY